MVGIRWLRCYGEGWLRHITGWSTVISYGSVGHCYGWYWLLAVATWLLLIHIEYYYWLIKVTAVIGHWLRLLAVIAIGWGYYITRLLPAVTYWLPLLAVRCWPLLLQGHIGYHCWILLRLIHIGYGIIDMPLHIINTSLRSLLSWCGYGILVLRVITRDVIGLRLAHYCWTLVLLVMPLAAT